MKKNGFDALRGTNAHRIKEELDSAYDFDAKDPLFGLTRDELSGPKLERPRRVGQWDFW